MHERFSFKTQDDLLKKAEELGIELPFQENLDPLFEPLAFKTKRLPNRLAVHPMEGFDGENDGAPGELTFRRYQRFAQGGFGLIWFEATSVEQQGRSNPRQLMLNEKTLKPFESLVTRTRQKARQAFGSDHDPYLVLQMTHSGRNAAPDGKKTGCRFDDRAFDKLREQFVQTARLAMEVGFDAVDLKACHGYLLHELLFDLSPDEPAYIGSDPGRARRFFIETLDAVQQSVPGIEVAVRLSLFDGLAAGDSSAPSQSNTLGIDLSGPFEIIKELKDRNCALINATMGIPSKDPSFGRPFDRPIPGDAKPKEHPLQGVARLINGAGRVQKDYPDLCVVGTGYSWLRQFFPHVAAAVLARKEAAIIGLGRMAIAYPDAPKDLMDNKSLNPKKTCITCSGCSELMRRQRISGCVTRDREVYGKVYKEIQSS